MLQLTETLNLAVPMISDDHGTRIWAYHTPIPKEVFEANYRVLCATQAALASKGAHYQVGAGPRIASLALRDEGLRDAEERGYLDSGGSAVDRHTQALLAEIKRLTLVLVPTNNGWENMPVNAAIAEHKIDEEDWSEAESLIVFFTCHYAMSKKASKEKTAKATASVIGASITSLLPMDFAASLPSSTPKKHSSEVVFAVPS